MEAVKYFRGKEVRLSKSEMHLEHGRLRLLLANPSFPEIPWHVHPKYINMYLHVEYERIRRSNRETNLFKLNGSGVAGPTFDPDVTYEWLTPTTSLEWGGIFMSDFTDFTVAFLGIIH